MQHTCWRCSHASSMIPCIIRLYLAAESGEAKPKGWVPQWLRERLPESVGGIPASEETEELTLDSAHLVLIA